MWQDRNRMTKFTRKEEEVAGIIGIIGCVFFIVAMIYLFFGSSLVSAGLSMIGFALLIPVLRILYEQGPR